MDLHLVSGYKMSGLENTFDFSTCWCQPRAGYPSMSVRHVSKAAGLETEIDVVQGLRLAVQVHSFFFTAHCLRTQGLTRGAREEGQLWCSP